MRAFIIATLWMFAAGLAAGQTADRKQILVCVSDKASGELKQAVESFAKNAGQVPVLKALIETQGAGAITQRSSEEVLANYDLAAYNHVVVIGLKSQDPLVDKTWEFYASVDEARRQIYMQGWGCLQGDLGYVESDRNPFLHSRRIKEAPFFTVIFRISGTSEKGVLAALDAFSHGTLNALVPAGPLARPETTILDLDPLVKPAPLKLPAAVTIKDHTGRDCSAPLVGVTQVPANEYRAYIDVAKFEPLHVWRYKYLEPHIFDLAGVRPWLAGFHRMAWGNSVTIAEFASADQAQKTAAGTAKSWPGPPWPAIGEIGGSQAWQTTLPADKKAGGPPTKLTVFSTGSFLILSSLPPGALADLAPPP